MHDGSVEEGDKMFYDHLLPYIDWAKTHNSLFILTFDEDDLKEDNHIVTLFSGEMVKAGKYSVKIDHYSLLRTIEDMYSLPNIANSATAIPITDCWKLIDVDNDVQDSNAISVFPNPSDHTVTIQLDEKIQLTDLKFYLINIQGEIVKEVPVLSSKSIIRVSGFSSGIYLYQLVRNKAILKKGKLMVK